MTVSFLPSERGHSNFGLTLKLLDGSVILEIIPSFRSVRTLHAHFAKKVLSRHFPRIISKPDPPQVRGSTKCHIHSLSPIDNRSRMLLVMRSTCGSAPRNPCTQSVVPDVNTVPPRV